MTRSASDPYPGTPGEVLRAFLRLGLTSFGGPVAHLGYFRAEFVGRRGWLAEQGYADLVGLCQFLPGPASSQAGFALGLMRAGAWGGLAAWAGFTLPSAVLMAGFALLAGRVDTPLGAAAVHGLQLVAVAVVAQAVWGMARSLCPDRTRATLATGAAALAVLLPPSVASVAVIVLGAGAGAALCRGEPAAGAGAEMAVGIPRRAGAACLVLFALLLAVVPLLRGVPGVPVFDAFYRSGALVFGGGHVVLPLLRDAVVAPGWVPDGQFLAGYGAAQAMPGPLFTFAAFLGVAAGGWAGGIVALVAIFLPGLLLLAGVLPFWDALRRRPGAQAAIRGANAAVVGLLGAALYDPVWSGAVRTGVDFALALAGLVLLVSWRCPPLAVAGLLVGGAVLAH